MFLGLKDCPAWFHTIRHNLPVAFIQFLLPSAGCPVFFLGDLIFGRGEQVNLIEIFPVAHIHDGLLKMPEVTVCQVVLITGTAVTGTLHKGLRFHVQFPEGVYNDVNMDVSTAIVTVHMGADERLMARKILSGIFHSEGLRLFPGQAMVVFVLWIKAQDIVMGFDIIIVLVLVILGIQLFTFFIKEHGFTVDAVHVIFLP